MSGLLHELVSQSAARHPDREALVHGNETLNYRVLQGLIERTAAGLLDVGLGRQQRVAVYLPKRIETVATMFGAAAAGGVFVPINPLLKPLQVGHILRDCNVRILVTARDRARPLAATLTECPDLGQLVLIDGESSPVEGLAARSWQALLEGSRRPPHRVIDTDMAAILYTSGSTGRPKGVVLSHRNMVTGAHSVAEYLENRPTDRILAVLPLSFDAGFSQLSTSFSVGACAVLMDYLLPRDVIQAVVRHRITGLAGVPPLWVQLADLEWSRAAAETLRYFTNTGGAMPTATLGKLRAALPDSLPYLMYGLTEAFRSTYLPPAELDRRPGSIGKAIPNVEIMVVRPDGTACDPDEPGELVHRGSLVALGYWNDPETTALRFKPAPGQDPGVVLPEIAVWSGDTVKKDAEGYLYFIGRRDEMIKTSGYRVSPTEIEEVVYGTGLVGEVAAVGVPHPQLGQAIVLVATASAGGSPDGEALLRRCQAQLPNFMVPKRVLWRDSLPRNPNGKIDRRSITSELGELYSA